MAKALKTVGIVVAVVALAATGVGIAAGGSAAAAVAGSTAATAYSVAGYAGLASGVLGAVSALAFKPKFSSQGSATSFQTNPQSGLPYAFGRTRMSGLRIHADTTDGFSGKTKNDLLGFAVLLSAGGEIDGIEKFTADGEAVTFDGAGNALGRFRDYMAQKLWTGGAMASALALALGYGSMPGWTAEHKLSGMTHALWMLRFETDGSKYGAGVPEPAWIGRWAKVYDPRLDSTYPGGSGSCRALNESTYVWSRNPPLHALTWCLGRWQNGKKVLGIGAPVANIRVADFVEAANVADANGWNCGGVEWSTDSKWAILKRMLQAGGAVPTMTGAMIGCRVYAPRISIATITGADLLDELTVATTKPRRDRFNTVIPRYRSEENDWEIISAAPVSVPAYVTMDGGVRQKEIDYPLVQSEVGQTGVDGDLQAGQLAAYDIVNSREAGPISWAVGPKYIGLKTGDCITLDVPEEGLDAQPVIITSASLDPSTGKISFTAETETNSKHAFALGTSAVPPLAYALTPTDLTPPTPTVDEWTLAGALDENGMPYLTLAGDLAELAIESVLVQYRRTDAADWTVAATLIVSSTDVIYNITGVDGGAEYLVRVAYRSRTALGDWFEVGPAVAPTPTLTAEDPRFDQLADDLAAAQSTIDDLTSDAAQLRDDIVAAGGEIDNLYSITSTQGAAITSNANAISNTSGNLANLTIEVRAGGNPNFLPNGGFENGSAGWVLPEGAVVYPNASGWGSFLQINFETGALTKVAYCDITTGIPAAGQVVTISGDAGATANITNIRFDIYCYDGAGNELAVSSVNFKSGLFNFQNDNSNRAAMANSVTIPAGTTRIRARCRGQVSALGTNQYARFRLVKLERGNRWTPYTNNAGITQAFTAISSTSLQVAQVQSDLAVQGATVSAHSSAISDLQSQIATLELRAVTGSNMLTNSTFEDGMTGWNHVNGPFSASPNDQWGWGPYTASPANMVDNQWRYLWRDVPVAPNVPYTLSADHAFFFSGVGRFYVQIDYLDSGANPISGASASGPSIATPIDFDPEDQKRFATALTLTSPPTAAFARIYLVFYKSSGTVSATSVRRVKFERGTKTTPYTQEASVAFQMQSINANLARAALRLDVNGRWTGYEIASNGQVGSIDMHADYFSITKPGGGARTEFSNGNWRVYDSNGVLRVRMGVW